MHVAVRHAIPCDADAYWRLFLDQAFFHRLCDRLGVTSIEEFQQRGTLEHGFTRRTVTIARIDAPWVLKRALGLEGGSRNVEEGRFEPEARRWTFHITPTDKYADRLDITGAVHIEDRGVGVSDRVFEADIVVDVGPLGPIAERVVEARVKHSQEQIVGLLRETFAS